MITVRYERGEMGQKRILDVLFHRLTIKSFFIPFKALLSSELKLQIYSWGSA